MTPKPKPVKKPREKPRRRKKSERRQIGDELDRQTSLIVRWRDGQCVLCGSTANLQCGHLVKRGKHSIRWDLKNCNAQCASCNLRHNNYPERYTNWFLHVWGKAEYARLAQAAEKADKFTVDELRTLRDKYQALLDNRPNEYAPDDLKWLGYFG